MVKLDNENLFVSFRTTLRERGETICKVIALTLMIDEKAQTFNWNYNNIEKEVESEDVHERFRVAYWIRDVEKIMILTNLRIMIFDDKLEEEPCVQTVLEDVYEICYDF